MSLGEVSLQVVVGVVHTSVKVERVLVTVFGESRLLSVVVREAKVIGGHEEVLLQFSELLVQTVLV